MSGERRTPGRRHFRRLWTGLAILGCGFAQAATFTGTVFEDANYGGGAGRTRAASGGTVLPGVVVELYRVNNGNFVATRRPTPAVSIP